MSGRSVFISEPDTQIITMFKTRGWELADTPDESECDMVCFTGGADITPILYGEKRLSSTLVDLPRDLREIKLIKSLPPKLPKVGICRGGQLLNVMCGGTMFQHVDGHAIRGMHDMQDMVSGEVFMVTSTHHQMMDPGPNAFWVALAKEARFKQRDGTKIQYPHTKRETWDDAEVLYYEEFNSFCYQPHPEYVRPGDRCQEYFFDMVDMYLFAKL